MKRAAVGLALVLFALFLWASAAGAQTPAGTAESHHAAGVEHLQAGRLNEAAAEFRQALRLDPNHVPSLVDLADLFSSAGGVFEAYGVVQYAARLAPDHPRVQLLLGRCLFLLKKFHQARGHFHRALALDPSLTEPHFALAVIETEEGRYAEARQHIETYLQSAQGPERLQALQARLRVALGMKDYDAALEAYAALREANPDDVSLQMEIARTLLTANRYAEAEEAFRAISRENPRLPEVWRGLFDAAYKRGAYDQAIAAMQELARLLPDSCEPQLHIARTYRMLNRLAEARQHAQRCLALSPQQAFAHYLLGRIWLSEGDPAQAKQELEQSVNSNPDFADAVHWLATAELQLGEKAAAVAHLEKAVQLDPELAAARYTLALEYSRLNRRAEAREQLEEFRQLKSREKWKAQASEGGMSLMGEAPAGAPGGDSALGDWLNFGKYLVQENKPRDALSLLEEARRRAPENGEVLRMIAVAQAELGEVEEALTTYAEAEKQEPSGLLFLDRGKIYFRLGEDEQARADLERATALDLPADKAAEAHLLLASLFNHKKKYGEAEIALRRVLALDANQAGARSLLGWTLLQAGKAAEAAAECRRALQQNPGDASARLVLARALIEQKETGEAARQIEQAAKSQGEESGLVLLARGELAAAQGMDKVALDYLAQAGRVDPSQVEAFYQWGRQLMEANRPSEAAVAFEKATIVDATHSESWLELGKIYRNANRLPAAIGYMRKAVAAAPESAEAHYQLAVVLRQAAQLGEAQQEARQAQALGHPEAERLLRSLAGQDGR